jgi:hypothetical protein
MYASIFGYAGEDFLDCEERKPFDANKNTGDIY